MNIFKSTFSPNPRIYIVNLWRNRLLGCSVFINLSTKTKGIKWWIHFLPHAATRKITFGSHQEAVAVLTSTKLSKSSAKSFWVNVGAIWNQKTRNGLLTQLIQIAWYIAGHGSDSVIKLCTWSVDGWLAGRLSGLIDETAVRLNDGRINKRIEMKGCRGG